MRRRRSNRPGRLATLVIAGAALVLAVGAGTVAIVTASALTVGPVIVPVTPPPLIGGGTGPGTGVSPAAQSGSGSTGLIGIGGLPLVSPLPLLGGGATPSPTPPPTLPGDLTGGVTPPCLIHCSPPPPPCCHGTTGGGSGSGNQAVVQGSGAVTAVSATGSGSGGTSGATGEGGLATAFVTERDGLNVNPPPPVEQLTPLAGINFGQAPYLWPMFLLLDVIAAGAVVLVVRKTWSTAGAD